MALERWLHSLPRLQIKEAPHVVRFSRTQIRTFEMSRLSSGACSGLVGSVRRADPFTCASHVHTGSSQTAEVQLNLPARFISAADKRFHLCFALMFGALISTLWMTLPRSLLMGLVPATDRSAAPCHFVF